MPPVVYTHQPRSQIPEQNTQKHIESNPPISETSLLRYTEADTHADSNSFPLLDLSTSGIIKTMPGVVSRIPDRWCNVIVSYFGGRGLFVLPIPFPHRHFDDSFLFRRRNSVPSPQFADSHAIEPRRDLIGSLEVFGVGISSSIHFFIHFISPCFIESPFG